MPIGAGSPSHWLTGARAAASCGRTRRPHTLGVAKIVVGEIVEEARQVPPRGALARSIIDLLFLTMLYLSTSGHLLLYLHAISLNYIL